MHNQRIQQLIEIIKTREQENSKIRVKVQQDLQHYCRVIDQVIDGYDNDVKHVKLRHRISKDVQIDRCEVLLVKLNVTWITYDHIVTTIDSRTYCIDSALLIH